MTDIKIGGVYRLSGSPYSFDGSPCQVVWRVKNSETLYMFSVKNHPGLTWTGFAEWLKPFNAVKYL